ncbi:MAG: TetR/AcrR family transcriptional regulator [Parvularculaceae bacterium]|nr:TetR/AcrR family transcriptional regulator [Parvularculaceae bacterium]
MTVRTKTKRERVAAKEEAIVAAATDAFLQGGLRAARMAEIAKAADVAEGTLYLYFRNKEALFAAVVERHWQGLTAGAKKAVGQHDEPMDQLESLARFTLTRILDDWALFELTFAVHYGSEGGDAPDNRRDYVKEFDRVIERGIDRGQFPATVPVRNLRDLFFGCLEYSSRSMLARRRSKPDDYEATIRMVMAAIAGAAGARQPTPARAAPDRLEAAVDRLEELLAQHEPG